MDLFPALAVSLAGSLLARAAGALTSGGAGAAALLGTVVLLISGWSGAAVLAAFFLPATLIGRVAVPSRIETRTAAQVWANGGPATLGLWFELARPGLGFWILTISLAAASADTWATALGSRSPREPRLLGTRRTVPRGTSGGVSTRGTLGGLAGAVVVAGTGAALMSRPELLVLGSLIGWGGMFLDSALGAGVQGRFVCPACGVPTEQRRHQCGTRTLPEGGWEWLDNNGVNFLATLAAAAAALASFRSG